MARTTAPSATNRQLRGSRSEVVGVEAPLQHVLKQ
jgi:hypothetical protein